MSSASPSPPPPEPLPVPQTLLMVGAEQMSMFLAYAIFTPPFPCSDTLRYTDTCRCVPVGHSVRGSNVLVGIAALEPQAVPWSHVCGRRHHPGSCGCAL